ncbi:hypothetical protein [Sporosarcina sp. A2]|uniref:hypothetical protein n=1 Tax=Sporosarcina sp. A2 TaxID=3393449 RepID=UPI003D7AE172
MKPLTIEELKAIHAFIKVGEHITIEERVSNFIYHDENRHVLHGKSLETVRCIVAEYKIKFMLYEGIACNGVSRIIERELTRQGMFRIKPVHAVHYSKDFPRRKSNLLDVYANVTDMQLKRAGNNSLEGSARNMITANERAEQFIIKAAPPVNSKEYVERADYSITSLYSDYKLLIEAKRRTWTDYRAERKTWRRCKYMYCLNMFPTSKDNFLRRPAKRSDATYCCEACRLGQKDADNRYKTNGSYLPVYFYADRLAETVGDEARVYERVGEADEIEEQINKKREVVPVKLRRADGGYAEGGEVKTFKSLEEARMLHGEEDREGWRKIS